MADCVVSYAAVRFIGKQSARPARRHEGRHGRRERVKRGDWRYEKRDDRYQAIVPKAIPGGLGGARTRVLQLAKLLLPRLSY